MWMYPTQDILVTRIMATSLVYTKSKESGVLGIVSYIEIVRNWM